MKNYSNKNYYKKFNSDADNQFDAIEATIAHLFRYPHPALGELPYGAAFCKQVLERGLLSDQDVIVEIGAGLGNFAYDFLVQLYREGYNKKYVIVDICEKLQERQKETLREFPNVSFHLADAESLPFEKISALVVCNEVIADLDSVEMALEEAKFSKDENIKCLLEFVSETEKNVIFNIGAVKLIKDLNRILLPGSNVVITEHGVWEDARLAITGKIDNSENSHIEFSINWKYLYNFSKRLGFDSKIMPLIDFLNFDKNCEVVNFNDVRALNIVYPDLPILAIPATLIEKLLNMSISDIRKSAGLRLPKIGEPGFPDDHTLPFSESFQVLILKKR